MAAPPATAEEESLLSDVASDEEEDDDRTPVRGNAAPRPCRRYIVDRCDGASAVGGGGRPPLRPCLPPPCVKWCPALLEQNPACALVGSCGFERFGSDEWRARIFQLALASNFVGFALTVASCMAISLNYDLLLAMGFSSGSLTSDNPQVPNAEIEIGLRGVAVHLPLRGNDTDTVLTFDEFCGRAFRRLPVQYFGDDVCRGCAETSAGLVSTLILSVFLYLPNVFTDFNRMHSGYDVNCQKAFGSCVSLLSLLLTLYTWRGYKNSCFSVFYEGVVPFDGEGLPLPPEEADSPEERSRVFVNMDFDWRAGNGLICVVAATMLKFVDIACNWLVPTPTITRNEEEQIEYENL